MLSKKQKSQYLKDLKPWINDLGIRKLFWGFRFQYLNTPSDKVVQLEDDILDSITRSRVLYGHVIFDNDFGLSDVKFLITTDWK